MMSPRFLSLLAGVAATALQAAPPASLTVALEHLRDQKSYSWEVINADPGPVPVQFETRRGTVTAIQQNMAPHTKGTLDRDGDMLIERQWSDGVELATVLTADGAMITRTPEGWMTDREILTAQADERVRAESLTARLVWLRRADRPEIRRPDQELTPLLKSRAEFEVNGDSYTTRIVGPLNGEPGQPRVEVVLTLNLRGGMIRDYEVKIEGMRRTRSGVEVPFNDQRIVILSYLPVSKIDIPDEAREKLKAARSLIGKGD